MKTITAWSAAKTKTERRLTMLDKKNVKKPEAKTNQNIENNRKHSGQSRAQSPTRSEGNRDGKR